MKLGTQVGLGPATLCYMGTQLPLPQRGTDLQFSAHMCCGQMAGWIKMPVGREVGLGPNDIVLDWTQLPLPQKNLAHVYSGQTAGWIKMPLGMKVGLGPGHIVLHGNPDSRIRGTAPPLRQFSADVYCGQTVAHLGYC